MRLLLDTHVFLWYIAADARLAPQMRDAIRDAANEVYLSVASIWEAVIKYDLGKLPLPASPSVYVPEQRDAHRIASLPIDEGAKTYLANLPPLHRDPFDRMLVAQALQRDLTLLTVDPQIEGYAVRRF